MKSVWKWNFFRTIQYIVKVIIVLISRSLLSLKSILYSIAKLLSAVIVN